MNQNLFETKQRAAELLNEAVKIWQSSEQSEYLEGLDTDPVFKLLLNALAYQANELESDIESFKEELLEEFEGVISRGEGVKATPAMTVISAYPAVGIPESIVDSSDEFFISSDNIRYTFTPLLRTRVLNASVSKILRLDARRWAVNIDFAFPVKNLSGFAFSVPFYRFQGLKVMFADTEKEIPVLSPFDFVNFPMAEFFSLDTVMYNRAQGINTGGIRSGMSPYSSYLAVDLFAGSLLDYYIFPEMGDIESTTKLELIFEFSGIPETFTFSLKSLKLNPVILINARRMSVNLSQDNPIEKLSDTLNKQKGDIQFLHLLPPADENSLTSVPIQVRKIGMERFNEGRLMRLLQSLIVKFNSDYYAFESIGSKTTDATMIQIQKNLSSLIHSVKSKSKAVVPGTYVYLDFHRINTKFVTNSSLDKNISIKVNFLCTDGSAVNDILNQNTPFSGPSWLNLDRVVQLVKPFPGMDEIVNKKDDFEISKYYLSTEDRIVTPYDVKMFCYKELQVRYGVVREMVKDIVITRRENRTGIWRTYEGLVTITMKANEFTERAFKDKIEDIQSVMARMIWARTNGVYPLSVKLVLNK